VTSDQPHLFRRLKYIIYMTFRNIGAISRTHGSRELHENEHPIPNVHELKGTMKTIYLRIFHSILEGNKRRHFEVDLAPTSW